MSSYTIPSFPEKNYGYLEGERDVAERIKRKLNGSLFRGVKVRVEDAGPDTFVLGGIPREEDEGGRARRGGGGDGNKAGSGRGRGVVDGIGLRDRRVRGGWTGPPTILIPAKSGGKWDGLSF